MKQLIAYDTRDGSILDFTTKSMESIVIVEGSGTIDAGVIMSDAFVGIDETRIVQLFVESSSRKKAFSRLTRLSSNSIDTGFKDFDAASVAVTIKGLGLDPPTHFTNAEKNAFKAEVIARVGHSNVDVIKIKTGRQIGLDTHEVNLSTGKIQRADKIEYE